MKTPVTKFTQTKKVFQIRYRSPRNSFEIFWAQEVWEVGGAIRCVGCHARSDSGLYAVKLNTISIPITLLPTIFETNEPEWWNRTRDR
jgi:hypothetical protein